MKANAPRSTLCLVMGTVLVLNYPLGAAGTIAGFLVTLLIAARFETAWLVLLPALLPIIGLAPWTGWITFEEFDMLVLALAAGGYGRLVWQSQASAKTGSRSLGQWVVLLLLLMFAASVLAAMVRGFDDAGGFGFGWFQGYHEPMNSVRLAKPFFLAFLLLPLWLHAQRQQPARANAALALGLTLGLAAAALATVWERAAFTDLLNFSADYRTTALFWEMHVGGAALDGFLALTVPFAVAAVLAARTPWRWGLAAGVLALAAYACLTTFSRGVYLAMPVGLLVFWGLQRAQGLPGTGWWRGVALVAGFGLGAAWMFPTSGYRGMLALWGTVVLMLPLVPLLRQFGRMQWALGVVAGALLTLVTFAMVWLVPKGAYVAWALIALLTAALLWLGQRNGAASIGRGARAMAWGGFLATLASSLAVASHWGESAGLRDAVPVLLAVLGVCVLASVWRRPTWPVALRQQAGAAGAMAVVAMLVGVMGGGAYMGDRFATGSQDLVARLAHWQLGRSMLVTPADVWLGKGLGRFASNYFLVGNPQQRPGDYRLTNDTGNAYLSLTGGLQVGAEMLRVSQRVAPPGQQAVVTARAQASRDVNLSFEICEKHLLYRGGCMAQTVRVKGAPGMWQDLRLTLQGSVSRGVWYAPRLLVFSVGVNSTGGKVSLDNLALTAADGQPMLANGDFSDDLAHWFFTSDRNHLPWHIKSLLMNVWFDQGALGLALWMVLLTVALWRLSLGPARGHPLAPALAAALASFVVVGLFDSLLDVPRVAWLYYFLLLVALTLQHKPVTPAVSAP